MTHTNIMTNPILRTEKLSKTFSTGGVQQHVIKNLDVQIYADDFTVIMGPSGGEAQRAGVARAVINQPRILFADEPTGALNSHSARMVLDILSEVSAKGQSIVMVTHDINSALRGNRILYLKDGAIDGELRLDAYNPRQTDDKERKAAVREFLAGMGW